jgi:hypothetical protein
LKIVLVRKHSIDDPQNIRRWNDTEDGIGAIQVFGTDVKIAQKFVDAVD